MTVMGLPGSLCWGGVSPGSWVLARPRPGSILPSLSSPSPQSGLVYSTLPDTSLSPPGSKTHHLLSPRGHRAPIRLWPENIPQSSLGPVHQQTTYERLTIHTSPAGPLSGVSFYPPKQPFHTSSQLLHPPESCLPLCQPASERTKMTSQEFSTIPNLPTSPPCP